MATNREKDLAYDAGVHAATTEPAERKGHDANPFAPGTEEHVEWLRGFVEGIEAHQVDIAAAKKALKEADNA